MTRKNNDAVRVVRICEKIRRHIGLNQTFYGMGLPLRVRVWATKLWNAIDCVDAYDDPEGLWDIMEMMLPEMYGNPGSCEFDFDFTYWDKSEVMFGGY